MAHVLIVEGSDPGTRMEIEQKFEPMGHDIRCQLDPVYKRATWGRRPEDIQGMQAVTNDLAGKR